MANSKKLTPFQMIEGNVFIITSRAGPVKNGFVAAWVTRLSFDPPLVGIALSPEHFTYWVINQSMIFTINFVSDDNKGVSLVKSFGTQSGRDVDKFKKVKYFEDKTGCPILKDAVAYIECRVVRKIKTGDHYLFIGKIVNQKKVKEKKILTRLKTREKGI